jgi:hypothetical protein
MTDIVFGLTLTDRLFVSLHDMLDYERSLGVLFGGADRLNSEVLASLDPARFGGLSNAELSRHCLAFLTFNHELRHVQQASNSVIGVHLAATQRQVAQMAVQLVMELRSDGLAAIGMPLLDARSIEVVQPTRLRQAVRAARLEMMEMLCEIQDLSGEGAQTIERALEHQESLAQARPGAARWRQSRREPTEAASPCQLSVRALMEGEARADDMMTVGLLMAIGVPEQVIQEVLDSLSKADEYQLAFDVFSDITGLTVRDPKSLELCVAAINFALWPAISRDGNLWEHVQPSWRFLQICYALRHMPFPERPLQQFEAFCGELSAAIGWEPPITAMMSRLKPRGSSGDIVIDDLYDRHEHFCRYVLKHHEVPFRPGSAPPEYLERFTPWLVQTGERFNFLNYPKSRIPPQFADHRVEYIDTQLTTHMFGQDILFNRDFSRTEKLFRRVRRHLVSRGQWSPERLDYEWDEAVAAIATGDGALRFIPLGAL